MTTKAERLQRRAHEDMTLRAMFQTQSFPQIAQKLNRDESTIRRRARQLGIKRDRETMRRMHQIGMEGRRQTLGGRSLAMDAAPLANDTQDQWWARMRVRDEKFLERLRKAS
jgi:hypothetical protein